ncbi:MAG TPA: FliM/FliN family flagellar motor C-terminal domain-containing protein [Noviherbaspirillum sp.]|nr:FliM/FliN family flagellar motor C-terminal domain-containing protein [Noviherbaspirillum sp.]
MPWQLRCGAAGKSAWFGWQPEFVRVIQRQMFPSDQRHLMQSKSIPSIAADAGDAAAKGIVDRIVEALGLQADCCHVSDATGPEENAFALASGALLVRIKLDEHTIVSLLDHGCMRAEAGYAGAKSVAPIQRDAVNRAFGRIAVTLPVEIGEVEVDVGSLLTLAVGDVIRLETSVDQPLTVFGPERKPLFDAHPGVLEGKIAVEVVRRSDLQV